MSKKSGKKTKANQTYRTVALIAAALLALCIGTWLLISPALEKQRMLTYQNELLESISQGDGVIVLNGSFTAGEVDFYDDGTDAPAEEAVFLAATEPPNTTIPPALEVTGTGILYIDSIDAVLPVTNGVSTAQLKVAVGHVPQTAPIGSEGNAVIAGHRSYTYGQDFNRLGELTSGDLIRYEDRSGAVFTYEVFETLEVVPGDPSGFEQPEGEYILTLYTCTPIRTATHRLLVRSELVSQITIEEESN